MYIKAITSIPKTFSAQYTIDDVNTIDDVIRNELDNEIIFDCYKMVSNWQFVELSESCIETDVKEWCTKNLKGQYINHYSKWLIELPKDASWFILRWTNEQQTTKI